MASVVGGGGRAQAVSTASEGAVARCDYLCVGGGGRLLSGCQVLSMPASSALPCLK